MSMGGPPAIDYRLACRTLRGSDHDHPHHRAARGRASPSTAQAHEMTGDEVSQVTRRPQVGGPQWLASRRRDVLRYIRRGTTRGRPRWITIRVIPSAESGRRDPGPTT